MSGHTPTRRRLFHEADRTRRDERPSRGPERRYAKDEAQCRSIVLLRIWIEACREGPHNSWLAWAEDPSFLSLFLRYHTGTPASALREYPNPTKSAHGPKLPTTATTCGQASTQRGHWVASCE